MVYRLEKKWLKFAQINIIIRRGGAFKRIQKIAVDEADIQLANQRTIHIYKFQLQNLFSRIS